MSFPNPPNPYAASTAVPPGKAFDSLSGQTQLEYMRAIHYIFENPNWVMNAVWAFLANLAGQVIPVIPLMVLWGYQLEIFDSLLVSRGSRYPDFDINRIGDYLSRSVWATLAFLITALAWFAATVVLIGIMAAVIFGAAAAMGKDMAELAFLPGLLLLVLFFLAMMVVLLVISTPIFLRGGLTQDFGAAFDFNWISDFLRKMWVESVLSSLFIVVSAAVLYMCTCFLAAFIVVPLFPFVQTHFWYQLYVIYLARGGMPIPVKIMDPQPMTMPPQ